MANVMPSVGGSSRADRGQLILIAALSLAILFVALALIVNTAIYTENLATRGSDIGGGTEAVRYQDEVRTGVGGVIEFANYNENGTNESLQTELQAGIGAIDNHTGRQFALSNRAVEATLVSTVNGTRIAQTDESREFTNESNDANWTVVEDVDNTRAFQMYVLKDSLNQSSGAPFTILVDNDSATWRMNVTHDGSDDIIVSISGPNGDSTCEVTADAAWINVTDRTLAGTDCHGLSFGEGITGDYDIRYENASAIEGTYTLTVDNETLASSPEPHLDTSGQPFATHAIYSTNVTVIYQTPRLYYEATVRVAPGEVDG